MVPRLLEAGSPVRCLARDGALIIGSTETITGICPELEARRHLRAVYYQPRTAAGICAAA